MAFLYLHGDYVNDPRIMTLPDREFRGHVRVAAWLAQWNLTEFADPVPSSIGMLRKRNVERLVAAGVWQRNDSGTLTIPGFENNKLDREDRRNDYRPSTYLLLEELIERDGWSCGICKQPITCGRNAKLVHVDHVIPRARGGSDDLENLQLAHAHCNRWKGSRLESELDLSELVA